MKRHFPGILFAVCAGALCVPAWSSTDNTSKPPAPPAPQVAPAPSTSARPAHRPSIMDDFEGLTYSDEQKAQIRKVHEQSVSRLTLVSRDPKLNDDQKGAMLQGYMRMEYTEIFKLLTPEQQAEVRKKIAARREQENRDKKKAQPAHATRPPHP